MIQEEYNPEKHCCRYWWKDFCECVKTSMKEFKKKSRDKKVNYTLSFLKNNNIDYVESKTPNIVIINPKSDNVFLSLKQENDLFKCRYNGSKKWYTFSRYKFLEKFSKTEN